MHITMGDIRGANCPPLISSVMESLMSAQAWLYGVLDGAKYPQTKANTIKRSGKLSKVFLQRWAMYPIKDISVDFFNAMANQKRCHFSEFTHSWKRFAARLVNHLMMTSLTKCRCDVDSLCSLEGLIIELCEIAMNFGWVMLLVIIMGARFVCFQGYNPFRIWIKLSFFGHINAVKFREWCWIHSRNISAKDGTKMPQWFNSGTSPGQISTDSARSEPDPVHRLKVCVNFIEIGTS